MPAMSVQTAIESRRAIRKYDGTPIPEADLREILRLAGRAPSAFNAQPWRFVVVRGEANQRALRAVANDQAQVEAAAAVFVVYTDVADVVEHAEEIVHPAWPEERQAKSAAGFRRSFGAKDEASREQWGAEQGFLAVGFLLLAAQSLGYSTSPMAGFSADGVKALYGLPAHVRVIALVAVGVGAEEGLPTHRHPVDRVARFVG